MSSSAEDRVILDSSRDRRPRRSRRQCMLFAALAALLWMSSDGVADIIAGESDRQLEAELLALEVSGELLAPSELTGRIRMDLAAIRTQYPLTAGITMRPEWVPGELIVGMTEPAFDAYLAGEYRGFDEAFTRFGTPEIQTLSFIQLLAMTFAERYHPLRLAEHFAIVDGVRYAEPNRLIGDGNDIEAAPPRYTFTRAWGDCPSGCIHSESWSFVVADGDVNPLSIPVHTNMVGDINLDGTVGRKDLVMFVGQFGVRGDAGFYQGDFNGDGVTGPVDLAILQANLGNTAAPSQAAVPEPSAVLLLMIGTVGMAGGWRRRRRTT